MVGIVLFDTLASRKGLLPLSYTRAIADFRIGILTISEKWEKLFGEKPQIITENYLQPLYPTNLSSSENNFISSSILPSHSFIEAVHALKDGEALFQNERLLAFKTSKPQINFENLELIVSGFRKIEYNEALIIIERAADIFSKNAEAIEADFKLIIENKTSAALSDTNKLIGPKEKLFIEEGAVVEASVLNTNNGYIYIGKDAEIMENCAVRGPFALCESATLKMSTKIYGATTIGPHCKVGGEINNAVFFGFSNKAHDGFIGNSVIGEWCNLGADTNNSNLKNNYSNVDVWDYATSKNEDSGLQFHGLIMADHSKCGINTMFNTGTVVGVSANIFGGDFPPKFIPSFSWGGSEWLRTFSFDKAMEVAERVMERRGIKLSEIDKNVLHEVYQRDQKYREQLAKKNTL
jgi:UDP-N-acetylglucosamine diphosphorylase/glucosamine-1-phosphate N-acetyltransferase